MYCPHCGEEQAEDSRYCGKCGSPFGTIEAIPPETQNLPATGKSKKRLGISYFLVIGGAVLLLIILFVFLSNRKGLKLKYEWGTYYNEIKNNEIVLGEYYTSFNGGKTKEWHLYCEDVHHKVDGIQELSADDKVVYWTDLDGKLYRISYFIDDDLSVTEKLDILKKHYGNNIYIKKYSGSDARFFYYYWKVNDTIIELYNKELCYYDIEYCMGRSSFDLVIEYFNAT